MEVKSEQDFQELRNQFITWRKRFPMFTHDVRRVETMIESHITEYSKIMVDYRRTHSTHYLEKAQHELDEINRILSFVGKIELMALLSQG